MHTLFLASVLQNVFYTYLTEYMWILSWFCFFVCRGFGESDRLQDLEGAFRHRDTVQTDVSAQH